MQIQGPLTLLFAILALTPFQPADELVYQPKEGASLTRVFREKTELSLESASMTIDGEDESPKEVEVEVRNEREVTFTDELLEVDGGRVLKLARTFDSLSASTYEAGSKNGEEPEAGEGEGTSDLEGATVLFAWDEEEGEFTASYHEGCDGYDAELLEGLEAEADLSRLLPDEDVSVGDTWEIEAQVLASVLQPGGDLAFRIDTVDPENEAEGVALCYFFCLLECRGELEGLATLEYEGLEETDDGEFAAASFSVELSTTRDLIEPMAAVTEGLEVGTAIWEEMDELTVEYVFEGKGKLLWDVEAGCAHSLELAGELKVSLSGSMEQGGMEMSMELAFAGTTEITVEVRAD